MILIKRICFLIILIIIYIFIIKIKIKDVFSEKINLNLENEIGIIIYNNNELNFVLEINENINNLILLSYDKSFFKIKNVFDIDAVNNLVSDKQYINSNKYYNLDDEYSFKLYNYNFCIINGPNYSLNNCTFIYFNYIPMDIKFDDTNKVVFYSNIVSNDFKEMIYTKWLDIYELNSLNYTVLKIKKDDYNIINIPV